MLYEWEMRTQIWPKNLKGIYHLRGIGVDEKKIFKRILKIKRVMVMKSIDELL